MLNIRLPDILENELAQEAQQRHTSRSQVARDALTFYLRVQRRKRYINRMQQAAERLDDAETRAFADESVLFDNEALSIAEAAAPDADSGNKWWR